MPGKKKPTTTKSRPHPQGKFEDLVAKAALERVSPMLNKSLTEVYQQLGLLKQLTSEVAILASSFSVLQSALIDQKIVDVDDLRERNVVYEDLLHGYEKAADGAEVVGGHIVRLSASYKEGESYSEARPIKFKVDLETELSKGIIGMKVGEEREVALPIPNKEGETQNYKVIVDRISQEIAKEEPKIKVVPAPTEEDNA